MEKKGNAEYERKNKDWKRRIKLAERIWKDNDPKTFSVWASWQQWRRKKYIRENNIVRSGIPEKVEKIITPLEVIPERCLKCINIEECKIHPPKKFWGYKRCPHFSL